MPRQRTATHRRIWEIDSRYHCGLIGTCLRLDDLRALCRRAGIVFQTQVSDYDLHHAFVDLADQACYATRLLQRRLDDRHRESLRHFATAKDEATLAQRWQDAKTDGDIAGAYWALLSHPRAEAALCDSVAGEVHMLSHLAGAARFADLKRFKQIQERRHLLEQWLRDERQNNAEQQAIIRTLKLRLANAVKAEEEIHHLRARLQQFEQGDVLLQTRRQCEELAAALAHARLMAERHAAESRHMTERGKLAERTAAATARELAEVTAERNSLEELTRSLTRHCAQSCSSDCPRFDLCRRRILYVGGRPTVSPHLRQLVEQANGEFLHHDGGREEADNALAALVPGADAVLCPVDCVSHSAMLRIKRLCKQQAKPFLILRSASISAFVHSLQEWLNTQTASCELQ